MTNLGIIMFIKNHTTMKKFFITGLTLLAIIFLSACSKDKNNNEPFNETCNAVSPQGLLTQIDGDISYAELEDTAKLNEYVACLMECSQNSQNNVNCIMNCLDDAGLMPAGGTFNLSLKFTNTTSTQITYTIVPGTWFFPGSSDYQPMLIAVPVTIIIEAHETIDVTIPVFCLAASKSAPDFSSTYTMCDVVSSGCLAEIVNILKTKDLMNLSIIQTTQIQDIIWDCAEGEKVDYDYLKGLPSLK
jgi:hypothetical protein